MLYRRGKSRFWWAKFKLQGRYVYASTHETDKRVAAKLARQLQIDAERKAGPGRAPGDGPTLEDLAAMDIQRSLAQGADPKTRVVTLENLWTQVLKHFGTTFPAKDLSFDKLEEYVFKRRQAGRRGQTIRREVQALKRALGIAKRRKLVGEVVDEWPRIKSDPPNAHNRGKLYPPEVVRRFLDELPDEVRDLVSLIALTGLRKAEAQRVEAGWIEPAPVGSVVAAVLRIPSWAAKTRRERVVGIPPTALAVIHRRAEAQAKPGPLFSQRDHKKAIHEACKRLGLPEAITLRDLRHTYATLAAAAGTDPVALMRALGHSDLRTTEMYLSSTVERIANVGAVVERQMLGEAGQMALRRTENARGGDTRVVTPDRDDTSKFSELLSKGG